MHTPTAIPIRTRTAWLLLTAASALVACSEDSTPVPTPPASGLTLVGVAATGRALVGATPASYYTAFTDTVAAAQTNAAVSSAVTRVVNTLRGGGTDFSTVGHVLSGTLVAANGSNTGNAFDQALDALNTRMTNQGVDLPTLTEGFVRISPINPAPSTSASSY